MTDLNIKVGNQGGFKIPGYKPNDSILPLNEDVPFSGIRLSEYPDEKKWYEKLDKKLKQLKAKSSVDVKQEKKDVMHPRDYNYIVKNFLALYNEKFTPKMKVLRPGKSIKKIINMRYVDYQIHIFVEFPNRKSYYGYEIMVRVQRDASKNAIWSFSDNIIDVQLKGAVGLSDLKFGVPVDLKKNNSLRFYKDSNQYGEYKFTFKDEEVKKILEKGSGKVQQINESDKKGEKNVLVGTKRNIYTERRQRGEMPKPPRYVPARIYKQPQKKEGRLQIGYNCLDLKNGKIVANPCRNVKLKFKYENNKFKHQGKCLSYHKDGDMELINCDSINQCKPNETYNNCMNFKFIKYGGLEIMDNNSCVAQNKGTIITEQCDQAPRINMI